MPPPRFGGKPNVSDSLAGYSRALFFVSDAMAGIYTAIVGGFLVSLLKQSDLLGVIGRENFLPHAQYALARARELHSKERRVFATLPTAR